MNPIQSWRVASSDNAAIEVDCHHHPEARERNAQHTFTCHRAVKTGDDWKREGELVLRVDEIPILMFLMSKANEYAMEHRTA